MTADRLGILYPSGFYAFQTPVLLDYVAAINGKAPAVPQGGSFTYLDLGCGDGFTLILLAAMYPEARFVGVDLEPAHIERGRALAAAGGLSNVALIEGAFEDWRRLDLPRPNYVALHGVWAWIAPEARVAVVELLAELLLPGGFVYLGYNALPGWGPAAALRQFFLDWTKGVPGDPLAAVAETMQRLRELRDKGAGFFAATPLAGALLDEWSKRDFRYVAHEIFAPYWAPQPFAAVAEAMAGAELSYVGSAELARNFPKAAFKPALQPTLARERDPLRAELLGDLAANTRFRRDLFVKGPSALDVAEFTRRPFGAKVPLDEHLRELPLPAGKLDVSREPFASLKRRFADGGRSLDELAAELLIPKQALLDALQALTLGLQVAPFRHATTAPKEAPKDWIVAGAINRHLLDHPVEQDGHILLAAPATGSALALSQADAEALRKRREAPRGRLSKWFELGLIDPA